jgi:hypothetical protein
VAEVAAEEAVLEDQERVVGEAKPSQSPMTTHLARLHLQGSYQCANGVAGGAAVEEAVHEDQGRVVGGQKLSQSQSPTTTHLARLHLQSSNHCMAGAAVEGAVHQDRGRVVVESVHSLGPHLLSLSLSLCLRCDEVGGLQGKLRLNTVRCLATLRMRMTV